MKSLLKATAAALLVVVYAFSALQLNSLHSLFHQESATAQHTEQNEKDPCHRSIYHDDTQEGCRHNSHVTTSLKCGVCSSVTGKEHLISFLLLDGTNVVHTTHHAVEALDPLPTASLILPSRAPPHVA